MTRTGPAARVGLGVVVVATLAKPALAHVGSLSGAVGNSSVPLWLVATTGGAIVGVSFLFATFMTDDEFIRAINARQVGLPSVPSVGTAARRGVRLFGVAALLLILATAVDSALVDDYSPTYAQFGFPILVVWAGWWAGYTMTVYLVGNSWPVLNPWRTLADGLTRALESLGHQPGRREIPDRWGVRPATVGLLAMVWIEVVSPVASLPGLLAGVVLAYTAVTLAGAAAFGVDAWFGRVDPVAAVFRWYGRMAPVQRTDDGFAVRLPAAALGERNEEYDATPFVLALLWVTTYDGLVATPSWNRTLGTVVEPVGGVLGSAGVPAARTAVALVVYTAAMLVGYAVFLGAYRLASRRSPRSADSFLRPEVLERRFLPALVPIAAGYHVAHFAGYLLNLSPALVAALGQPFSPPLSPYVLVLPGWFEVVRFGFVVLGHMLAVWVAHGIAFETFPGRLKPIRSQYPYMLVMVFYTTVSMWIVAQPFVEPAYLP